MIDSVPNYKMIYLEFYLGIANDLESRLGIVVFQLIVNLYKN